MPVRETNGLAGSSFHLSYLWTSLMRRSRETLRFISEVTINFSSFLSYLHNPEYSIQTLLAASSYFPVHRRVHCPTSKEACEPRSLGLTFGGSKAMSCFTLPPHLVPVLRQLSSADSKNPNQAGQRRRAALDQSACGPISSRNCATSRQTKRVIVTRRSLWFSRSELRSR